jgi:inner membrane protein
VLAGSHVVLGAAAWLVAAPALGLPALDPAGLALAVGGALLPDIDHPKSWVGRRTKPLSSVIAGILGHRGATHSLLAVVGCAWLLFHGGYSRTTVAPVVVGYLSHLAGDLLTPRGLRLAWPLRGTWALPLCKSGSFTEPLIVVAILLWFWTSLAPARARQAVLDASHVCDLAGARLPMLCGAEPGHAAAAGRPSRVLLRG